MSYSARNTIYFEKLIFFQISSIPMLCSVYCDISIQEQKYFHEITSFFFIYEGIVQIFKVMKIYWIVIQYEFLCKDIVGYFNGLLPFRKTSFCCTFSPSGLWIISTVIWSFTKWIVEYMQLANFKITNTRHELFILPTTVHTVFHVIVRFFFLLSLPVFFRNFHSEFAVCTISTV